MLILRIKATRKLRRLQRKEFQDLKDDYLKTEKDMNKFKDERKKMRKTHKQERDSFNKQENI